MSYHSFQTEENEEFGSFEVFYMDDEDARQWAINTGADHIVSFDPEDPEDVETILDETHFKAGYTGKPVFPGAYLMAIARKGHTKPKMKRSPRPTIWTSPPIAPLRPLRGRLSLSSSSARVEGRKRIKITETKP